LIFLPFFSCDPSDGRAKSPTVFCRSLVATLRTHSGVLLFYLVSPPGRGLLESLLFSLFLPIDVHSLHAFPRTFTPSHVFFPSISSSALVPRIDPRTTAIPTFSSSPNLSDLVPPIYIIDLRILTSSPSFSPPPPTF